MGGWLLEVGKMALYMTIPVGFFHYFNQPEYFESFVISKKREMYPPEDKSQRAEVDAFIRKMQAKRDDELTRALNNMEQNQKS